MAKIVKISLLFPTTLMLQLKLNLQDCMNVMLSAWLVVFYREPQFLPNVIPSTLIILIIIPKQTLLNSELYRPYEVTGCKTNVVIHARVIITPSASMVTMNTLFTGVTLRFCGILRRLLLFLLLIYFIMRFGLSFKGAPASGQKSAVPFYLCQSLRVRVWSPSLQGSGFQVRYFIPCSDSCAING